MRAARDSSEAVAAFIAKKTEIDAMHVRLMDLSANHFDVSPDTLHWGHFGNLEYYAELLKRITDAAFKDGEHAT